MPTLNFKHEQQRALSPWYTFSIKSFNIIYTMPCICADHVMCAYETEQMSCILNIDLLVIY